MRTNNKAIEYLRDKFKTLLCLFAVIAIIAALFFACNLRLMCAPGEVRTRIDDLTPELREAVYEDVGVWIPEGAELIDGEIVASFRDSLLTLTFEMPTDKLEGYAPKMDESELGALFIGAKDDEGRNRYLNSGFTTFRAEKVKDGMLRCELKTGDVRKVWSAINR